MIKLGKMKKAMLEAAAGRENAALLPAPKGMETQIAARNRALKGLLKDGLAEERPASSFDIAWREDDGVSYAIFVTAAGLGALGAVPRVAEAAHGNDVSDTKRPLGKLGQVLDAVEAREGASLDDLIAATGWLPHTTRAVITRLRQRGHDIRLVTTGERKVYRLQAG